MRRLRPSNQAVKSLTVRQETGWRRELAVLIFSLALSVGGRCLFWATSSASDKPSKTASQSQTLSQPVDASAATSAASPKTKKQKSKLPPFDVATAIVQIDKSLKDAQVSKSAADWGAAFQSTVKAWEVARHYRDDATIKPKLEKIEVELEELGKKANQQFRSEINSGHVLHVVK